MKLTVNNLGLVESATIETGDLTIICGKNNLGKTYLTYAFYGMLKYLRSTFGLVPMDQKYAGELIEKGETVLQLSPIFEMLPSIMKKASIGYSKQLAEVFAADKSHFENARFSLEMETPSRSVFHDSSGRMMWGRKGIQFVFSFSADNMTLTIRQTSKNTNLDTASREVILLMISDVVRDCLLKQLIPDVYISSTERTGVVMFQRELDFTRNRLLDLIGKKVKNIPARFLFDRFQNDYPQPVKDNVDFIRSLPDIANRESKLMKMYPELLLSLSDIVGGSFKATKDGFVSYHPAKGVKLSIGECSSSIRSLLDVTFYLKNIAKPGDLFLIDEPELNLHPSNQRKIARLISRLVNRGIKVFMTTHSDYIVKELSTLILLKQTGDGFAKIAEAEGYNREELLDASRVRVYIAKEPPSRKSKNAKKSPWQSFQSAKVSQGKGIEVKSFDKTIDEMNHIQDRILWEVQ